MSLTEVATGVIATRNAEKTREIYAKDPVRWSREYLGINLWKAQRDILESIRDNRNTAVAAGHGVGKSFVAGIAVAWWVDTHPPEETFIATTAPTRDQVSILWDNIRRIHGIAKKRYEAGIVDHPLPGDVLRDNIWKLSDGTLLGQGRKPADSDAETSFQGRHATYLFAVGDEAVGLNAGFLEALGNIATAETNRQLLLANPTDPGSAMAKLWDEKITHWKRMHISVFDSPAVKPDPDFDIKDAPALSGWDYINEKRREWGEEDPRYIARVLGQWAFDAGNTVYTAEELANARDVVVVPDPRIPKEQGWDIARKGADSTVGYVKETGTVWLTDPVTGEPTEDTGVTGYRIRRLAKWSKAPLTGNDPDNPSTSNRIHKWALDEDAEIVKVDAAGIGSGVIDGLNELNRAYQQYLLFEVFGQAAPTDKRAYRNLRAEQFFEIKKAMGLKTLDLDPKDEDLFDELSGIQYENVAGGIIRIESKEEIRKEGRRSPDHADAVWYAFLNLSGLIDNPYANLKPGDKVYRDPDEVMSSDIVLQQFYADQRAF